MKINLTVHLNIEGNRLVKSGEFWVKKEADIPSTAYQWVKHIKMDTGYRVTTIELVNWNKENDVTNEVVQLENTPLDG